jgi:hypothetical protein
MRAFLAAVGDLLRGLFAFPANGASSTRAALEERYARPRRCC